MEAEFFYYFGGCHAGYEKIDLMVFEALGHYSRASNFLEYHFNQNSSLLSPVADRYELSIDI